MESKMKTAIVIGQIGEPNDGMIFLYMDGKFVSCNVTWTQPTFTPAQVAIWLCDNEKTDGVVSTAAVCGWLRDGLLRGFRVPGRGRGGMQWRVPMANLMAFTPPASKGSGGA